MKSSAGHQVGYRYDEHGRLAVIVLPDGQEIQITHDVGDRVHEVRFPNGVRGEYRYAPTGAIERLAWTRSDARPLAAWTCKYDSRGNVVAVERNGAPAFEYKYDADSRLVEERAGTRAVEYVYRRGSDRLNVTQGDVAVAYEYMGDHLISVGKDQFGYDSSGNLAQRSGPAGVVQYRHDVEGRLIGATTSKSVNIAFAYDASGERVARRDARGTIFFLRVGSQLVEEVNEKGATVTLYVHGLDRPLAMLRDGKTYFYHADAQGNIALVTDADGKVVASYETDAFGKPVTPLPALANPFIFGVREYDPALGLYFDGTRSFDPALGRYLSPKTQPGSPHDPATFNRYAYRAFAFTAAPR
jgi:RHS repeat-associated protein